jgi:hypothetical protein
MSRAVAKPKPLEDIVEVFSAEDYPQGSEAWFGLRLGMATASNFRTIMAAGEDGDEAKTRRRLLYRLAGEHFSKKPANTYENEAMRRGRAMEAAALEDYAFTRGVEVERVGFVRRTIKRTPFADLVVGCSPDGLVGKSKVVQIKTMEPELIVQMVDHSRFPAEHRAQCQGELWVTGRESCDLKIFYAGMPLGRTFTLQRDESYIATIRKEVEKFDYELRMLIDSIKAKGMQ